MFNATRCANEFLKEFESKSKGVNNMNYKIIYQTMEEIEKDIERLERQFENQVSEGLASDELMKEKNNRVDLLIAALKNLQQIYDYADPMEVLEYV